MTPQDRSFLLGFCSLVASLLAIVWFAYFFTAYPVLNDRQCKFAADRAECERLLWTLAFNVPQLSAYSAIGIGIVGFYRWKKTDTNASKLFSILGIVLGIADVLFLNSLMHLGVP